MVDKGKTALGKVEVKKRAARIQDLSDKVGVAINQFQAAQKKFEDGRDSYAEWKNIIKLLNSEIKEIQHFLAVAHHNMAIIHAGRREFDKARELLEKSLDLDPEYAMAWYNLAVTYKHLNNKPKAKECYTRAKDLGYQAPNGQ